MKIREIIKRMFITRKCIICSDVISYDCETPICADCQKYFDSYLELKCKKCGYESEYCFCIPESIKKIYHSVFCYCIFYNPDSKSPVNSLFYSLKRTGDKETVNFCSEMMKNKVKNLFDCQRLDIGEFTVVYPKRRTRGIKKYGFDHTGELAKALAEKLNIKIENVFINKGKKQQKNLSKKGRKENAENSYFLNEKATVKGKKYILVDDIVTTGSTMSVCSKLLYDKGAEAVIPFSFAKSR